MNRYQKLLAEINRPWKGMATRDWIMGAIAAVCLLGASMAVVGFIVVAYVMLMAAVEFLSLLF